MSAVYAAHAFAFTETPTYGTLLSAGVVQAGARPPSDPRMTIFDNVGEPLLVNGLRSRRARLGARGRSCSS